MQFTKENVLAIIDNYIDDFSSESPFVVSKEFEFQELITRDMDRLVAKTLFKLSQDIKNLEE